MDLHFPPSDSLMPEFRSLDFGQSFESAIVSALTKTFPENLGAL
jgi:hypothetical protein